MIDISAAAYPAVIHFVLIIPVPGGTGPALMRQRNIAIHLFAAY